MVRIITDSAADFEPAELEQKKITCIPLKVLFGTEEFEENISLSKELYPFIASRMQLSDYRAVEHSIRQAIHQGWEHRDPEIWNQYFPDDSKCPSNKIFLAVLSEFL